MSNNNATTDEKAEFFLVTIPANGLRLKAGRMENKPIPLKTLQSEVGGLIEAIYIPTAFNGLEDLDAFVNEDGIDAGLTLNMVATMLLKVPLFGNVVLCRYNKDGNTYPLSKAELELVADYMGGAITNFIEWATSQEAEPKTEKGIFKKEE